MLRPVTGQPFVVLASIRKIVLDARDEALLQKEFSPAAQREQPGMTSMHGKGSGKNGMAVSSGRPGKGKTKGRSKHVAKPGASDRQLVVPYCDYCGRTGHDQTECWYNPVSTEYREHLNIANSQTPVPPPPPPARVSTGCQVGSSESQTVTPAAATAYRSSQIRANHDSPAYVASTFLTGLAQQLTPDPPQQFSMDRS